MTDSSLELRRRLLQLVEKYPGLHMRELARQAEIGESHAEYHLNELVKAGVVESVEEEFFRRFYAAKGSPSDADRGILATLRQPVPLKIVLVLLERGAATQGELAAAVKVSKSTMSYHVGRLLDAGIVVSAAKPAPGIALHDPKHVERLLLKYRPPKDLTERVTDFWQAFYGHREKR